LLLITLVSARDTAFLLGHGLTVSPSQLSEVWQKAESGLSFALGDELKSANPLRRCLVTYLTCTGIETGYGYFAPNIPDGCKLVFELHYPNGRVEYELPGVSSSAAGLRLISLLDRLAQPDSDPIREYVIKTLVYSVWREHREVTMIRAVFESIRLPTATEFKQGKRESYEVLFAYDFTASTEPPDKQ
jgi:hypothetical protein